MSVLSNIVYYPGEGPALLTPSITPKPRPAGPPPPLNHLFEALLEGLRMFPVRISKPVIFHIEEEAMLLSVFYYCICNFLCRCHCHSFDLSLCHFSSFLLPCVTISRPCRLLELYPNMSSSLPRCLDPVLLLLVSKITNIMYFLYLYHSLILSPPL